MLPQINDLALEGHSCREIAARLGIGRTTVGRWLHDLREERHSKAVDTADMLASAIARYDAIYREAMDAWRNSKAGKEVRFVEDTDSDGKSGGAKKKQSVRTERQAGDIAFLAQAKDAVNAICKLMPAGHWPQAWDKLETEDEIRNMSDDELHEAAAAMAAEVQGLKTKA